MFSGITGKVSSFFIFVFNPSNGSAPAQPASANGKKQSKVATVAKKTLLTEGTEQFATPKRRKPRRVKAEKRAPSQTVRTADPKTATPHPSRTLRSSGKRERDHDIPKIEQPPTKKRKLKRKLIIKAE